MPSRERFKGIIIREAQAVPFESTEDAWFWFIVAQQAKNDGARFSSGVGVIPRPCEPVDILKILDALYRRRRLTREHFLILRHYGQRNLPPDSRRTKEVRASVLWKEAMSRLEGPLVAKGVVRQKSLLEEMAASVHRLPEYSLFDEERMAAE